MSVALAIAAIVSAHGASLPSQEASPFGMPIMAAEMAEIRGSFVPQVGLDLADAASSAVALPVRSPDLSSVAVREVIDNWNFSVAAPLIAESIRLARAP